MATLCIHILNIYDFKHKSIKFRVPSIAMYHKQINYTSIICLNTVKGSNICLYSV